MRILQVHGRYRSTAPSGENRVVDQEAAQLREAGHEVGLFEKRSDDIETWPLVRKAALPARVLWSEEARRELGRRLEQ
ncbi:MAG TPA: glycosyl transferase group 1 protein, partial [Nocardioides sp.]